jgi:Spy/CpxP family protein refolding chaperone
VLAVVVLGAAAPVAGQQHHRAPGGEMHHMMAMHCGTGMHGMMQRMHVDSAMPGRMAMMGPPAPAMLLQHRQQLGLSADQVSRLETLQKEAEPVCSEHMHKAMAAHRAANQMLEAAAPDYAAYTARMKEAASDMIEARVAMAKAGAAARALLTPAQRQMLESMKGPMHKRP